MFFFLTLSLKTESGYDYLTLEWGPCFTGSGERLEGDLAVPVRKT